MIFINFRFVRWIYDNSEDITDLLLKYCSTRFVKETLDLDEIWGNHKMMR